jgi:hypothetical protein
MKIVYCLFVIFISCSSQKGIHVVKDSTYERRDSVSWHYYSDSNRKDTTHYIKKYFAYEKTPAHVKGAWYMIAAGIVLFIAVVFLRR